MPKTDGAFDAAATRLVGGDRNSPMDEPLEGRAAVAEAIVATKSPFKPEDLVPRLITTENPPPPGFVTVSAEEAAREMARFDTTPTPRMVGGDRGEMEARSVGNWKITAQAVWLSPSDNYYHSITCGGACGIPFGCASQWQPDEIDRMKAHGPKDARTVNRINEDRGPIGQVQHFDTDFDANYCSPALCPAYGDDVGFYPGVQKLAPLRQKTSAERKAEPIHSAIMKYHPDAMAAHARLCVAGNLKHNGPDAPLHWARGKSGDHLDCAARHLLTPDAIDPETGETELTAAFWRLGCALQLQQERLLKEKGIMPYSGITS